MTEISDAPEAQLERLLASGRLHSAYLLAGPGAAPRDAALRFVRGMVCEGGEERPCEACLPCRRSSPGEPLPLDGAGRKGPLLRHVGDHPDLLWIERGASDTRVRIGQIRALQHALRLRGEGDGRRAGVVADAEWLNAEAQNALLRLLEEPPPRTSLVLVASTSAGLLATVRSRCQRIVFPPPPAAALDDAGLVARLGELSRVTLPELLDWAEEYRGARASAVEDVTRLLETGTAWLRERVRATARDGSGDPGPALAAHAELEGCRKALAQRNANPQMVAERALLSLRDAGLR